MTDEERELEATLAWNDQLSEQTIIAEKTEAVKMEERTFAEDKKRQEIEAARQKIRDAEVAFRERLEADFLRANNFATVMDFERLYDRMRDSIMIENLRKLKH